MNISGLLQLFGSLRSYSGLLNELAGGGVPAPLGLLRAARPAMLSVIARDLQKTVFVAVASTERANELVGSLRDWSSDPESILYFPEPPVLFYERAAWTEEACVGRLRVFEKLFQLRVGAQSKGAIANRSAIVVSSARALMQRTLPVREYRVSRYELHTGQMLDLDRTLTRWTGLGYEPVTVVEAPGQFSHRGGILDIFPPAEHLPVRVELFGNVVDSLRLFDPATQRSRDRAERVTITVAREALPRHGPRIADQVLSQLGGDLPADVLSEIEKHHRGLESGMPFPGIEYYLPYFYSSSASVLDYLPAQALVVTEDAQDLADAWSDLELEAIGLRESAEQAGELPPEYPLPYLTWDDWSERLVDRPVLALGHGVEEAENELASRFEPGPRFGGQIKPVLGYIKASQSARGQVVVVSQQAQRLSELWFDTYPVSGTSAGGVGTVFDDLRELPQAGVTFVQGALTEGWVLRPLDSGMPFVSFHLLTDAEIFGWRRPQARRRATRRRVAPETRFSDLTTGDLVVHVEYGIGVYRGLVTRAMEGEEREYLLVEYAGQDRLYVPIYQADRLTRYIGADDRPPSLNRLGAAEWRKVRERAQQAAEDVARELLELYAARELSPGHAFGPDTAWQAELESSFPYFETEDQIQAIADVKRDMEKPKPMDRLICGDVGFGKTEVAIRAAFKAVMDGKQVAILVPTTVLAQQHYATFRHRLAPFPVEIEVLSRFRSPASQQKILAGLVSGKVDIVVGTHRLLQKDVVFADLGLLVVDEEQRFGVTHKAHLKRLRTEVDVLTMTATPIPRTLYMALTGVWDISTIDSPPDERLPVSTYVGVYDSDLVRHAILRELQRGGQIYYVHNRVQTIETVCQRLTSLVPEAKFIIAHGQMKDGSLERSMKRFVDGEADVLVCTTIIENGLDIPNANTLIVERANHFGLAQLYQLRGRVGRGAVRAHAYLFHDRQNRLTQEARQRLDTIREATGLGAGYVIAMRDLEIRGAGDILGPRQSGQVAAVGFALYTRLLVRAVQELKAEREGSPPPPEPFGGVRIELPIPALLPEQYVAEERLRLQIYRRLAQLTSMVEIDEIERELTDRFGALPTEARNLVYQLRLKALARDARVSAITFYDGMLVLRPEGWKQTTRDMLDRALDQDVDVRHREIRLPIASGWRDRLIDVLRTIARVTFDL